ncbi:hypothetical protein M8J76_013025 [Diaphorina citri]|nr:hypothetical protein M8J76_013025 [Diaphorina citri]
MFLKRCVSSITIEPALLITFLTAQISEMGRANLVLQKLCYKNGTGPVMGVICPNEVAVQKEVAVVDSYRVTVMVSTRVLILILSSGWKRSRKPFILLPMLGYVLTDLLNIACTYWWQSSIWIQALGTGLLIGISGVGSLLMIGCMLYASDNTTPAERTLRIAIYQGLSMFCVPLGDYVSGYLMLNIGFYPLFIMSVVGNTISIVLIWKTMKESKLQQDRQALEGWHNKSFVPDPTSAETSGCADQQEINNVDKSASHNGQEGIANNTYVEDEKGYNIVEVENNTEDVQDGNNHDKNNATLNRNGGLENYKTNWENGVISSGNYLLESLAKRKVIDKRNETEEAEQIVEVCEIKEIEPTVQNGTIKRSDYKTFKGYCRWPEKTLDKKADAKQYQLRKSSGLIDKINPFKLCLNNIKVLIKPRDNYRTRITLLMTLVNIVLSASFTGEYSLLYYYVRAKFGWTESQYGEYAAFKACGASIGILFSGMVLGRLLKFKDTTIGLMACVSDITECIAYMFVNTAFLMYMVPLVDLFHGAAFIVSTSIMTKEIDLIDLSQVLVAQSILTSFVPIVTTPLYMMVYKHTVDFWPAAFFALGVTFSIPAFIAFGTVKYYHGKRT